MVQGFTSTWAVGVGKKSQLAASLLRRPADAAAAGPGNGSAEQLGVASDGADCNTRFIKGHKPSNHIHVRIKSHVYIIE